MKHKTYSSVFVSAPFGSLADQGVFLWASFYVSLFEVSNQGDP